MQNAREFAASAIVFKRNSLIHVKICRVQRSVDITKKFWVILVFLVVWAVLTVLAVTWGTRFDWPDYVHVDYGVPMVWATQTLSTIVGPVDLWNVDVAALMTDLALWLGIMVIVVAVMLFFFNKKAADEKKE